MKKVIARNADGSIDIRLFRHTAFAVLKYYITSEVYPDERNTVYELAFTPKSNEFFNERLTIAEARRVIDECDLELVKSNEYGCIWDSHDRAFWHAYCRM